MFCGVFDQRCEAGVNGEGGGRVFADSGGGCSECVGSEGIDLLANTHYANPNFRMRCMQF